MNILGVDPGLANVGWGVVSFDGKNFKAISYGTIETPKEDSLQKRLFSIVSDLGTLSKKYKIDAVSVEDIYFAQNITTAIPVAKVIGGIIYHFAENGIKTYLYSPKEIKMGVVGVGNADKNQVQEMVKRILKLKQIPRPDHAADALADCICHVNHSDFKILKS